MNFHFTLQRISLKYQRSNNWKHHYSHQILCIIKLHKISDKTLLWEVFLEQNWTKASPTFWSGYDQFNFSNLIDPTTFRTLVISFSIPLSTTSHQELK